MDTTTDKTCRDCRLFEEVDSSEMETAGADAGKKWGKCLRSSLASLPGATNLTPAGEVACFQFEPHP
jgi:hypothetical protein